MQGRLFPLYGKVRNILLVYVKHLGESEATFAEWLLQISVRDNHRA